MRLREDINDALTSRIEAFDDTLTKTAWDGAAMVVAVEELKFTQASGAKGDWRKCASMTGMVRAIIRTDDIDGDAFERLIANLITKPLHVSLPDAAPDGECRAKARADLEDWRDTVSDGQVKSALRFKIEGGLWQRETDPMAEAIADWQGAAP